MILAAKIEKEGESQVLKRYFELGHWLQYAKKFYKGNELRARYGKPFWGWARDRTSLSKSYTSKLRKFYKDFQDYEQITKCAVGLKFILKHEERIIEILEGLKHLLYNGAGAECNGANTFFSVKDSGVLRLLSK